MLRQRGRISPNFHSGNAHRMEPDESNRQADDTCDCVLAVWNEWYHLRSPGHDKTVQFGPAEPFFLSPCCIYREMNSRSQGALHTSWKETMEYVPYCPQFDTQAA